MYNKYDYNNVKVTDTAENFKMRSCQGEMCEQVLITALGGCAT